MLSLSKTTLNLKNNQTSSFIIAKINKQTQKKHKNTWET